MNSTYFVSEHIYLRALEPEDLDVLYTMENDPQCWDISNFTVPYSKYTLRQYINNVQCDMFADRQLRLMIIRRADNLILGTIDLTDFVPQHARGEVGIAIRDEFRGNGYGKEALTLLCNYAFGFLFLKQLTVHIAADNAASLRLFESCGFVRCGLLKEWWRVGHSFKDVVVLQCIRNQ